MATSTETITYEEKYSDIILGSGLEGLSDEEIEARILVGLHALGSVATNLESRGTAKKTPLDESVATQVIIEAKDLFTIDGKVNRRTAEAVARIAWIEAQKNPVLCHDLA